MAEWAQETRSPHSAFWFWTWVCIRITWAFVRTDPWAPRPEFLSQQDKLYSKQFPRWCWCVLDRDHTWTFTMLELPHSRVCVICMPLTPDLDTVHKMKISMSQKGEGKRIKISLGLLPAWPWPLAPESRVYHHYCCITMPWDLSGHSQRSWGEESEWALCWQNALPG